MKVPQKIKSAIIKCANYNNKARIHERTIVEWLEKNNLTEHTVSDITRNMDDSFIDYCQLGCNPEAFIKELEELKGENDE